MTYKTTNDGDDSVAYWPITADETEQEVEVEVEVEDEGQVIRQDEDAIKSLAWQVLRGEIGIGQARRDALGDLYTPVMAEVRSIRLGD